MIQRLPTPARSAARARSVVRPARPRPLSATPRLSVQRQSIGLAEDGEEATEVAVGGRHRRQPRAAGARIFQAAGGQDDDDRLLGVEDRKSTRLNSSHGYISYAVFCLKKKKKKKRNRHKCTVRGRRSMLVLVGILLAYRWILQSSDLLIQYDTELYYFAIQTLIVRPVR